MPTVRILAAIVVLLGDCPVRAQALEDLPPSAAMLGTAGAAAALARGADALWIDPAQLADAATGASAALAVATARRRFTTRGEPAAALDADHLEARDRAPAQLSPTLALVWPVVDRLTVAAGYQQRLRVESQYRPAALHPARYLSSLLSLTDQRFSLGAALKLWRLRFGAALDLQLLSLEHRRAIWGGLDADENRVVGDEALDIDAALALDGVALGARFGVAFVTAHLTLAAALELPSNPQLEGDVTLETTCSARPDCQPINYQSMDARGGGATLDLALPLRVLGALGVRPTSWLTLSAAFRYQRWSATGTPTAVLTDAAVLLEGLGTTVTLPIASLPLGIALRDAYSVHAGAELLLLDGFVTTRAGWSYHRGAMAPAAPSTALIDLDRHRIGFGLGVHQGTLTFAVAVDHVLGSALETDGADAMRYGPLAPGVEASVGRGRYVNDEMRVLLELSASL